MAIVLAWVLSPQLTEAVDDGGHFGLASLLPALTTLVLVFFTRDVVSSLFLGIVVAGFVLFASSGAVSDLNIIQEFLIPSIGSESFAVILLVYLWALGGLIGIWTRTGGARHFAAWAGERIVRGPRSAKFFAWLMGIIFHQGGTISTILAGTTVKSVTDRQKVSHEELTYVVDSTASPIATVIPLNAWPLYVAGLLVGTTPLFMTEQEVVSFFFQSIPFNFYGIFAITLTLLFALEVLPWEGKRMKAARKRARETGKLDRDEAEPLAADELTQLRVPENYRTGLADFAVPLLVLVGVALTGVVAAFFQAMAAGDMQLFLAGISVPIAEAFGLAVLSAMLLALVKGMDLKEVVDGFVDGCKGVTIGAIILALAVTLGTVSGALGTANFIVEIAADPFSDLSVLIPAVFMFICMAVAFSIGSSWGTYAVVFPLAMPLAYAINPDPFYMSLAFGAVLGGAVFGDQCSPISDTTILSSLACGCDVMDHVLTQLPLALAAALTGATMATLLAIFAM
ncbi:MAG: sodium:proton antiporter [Gemmatimonadales bacterium]|nr:MAG: sodium:proton antiporter [Gemmatimonadales bacterium]